MRLLKYAPLMVVILTLLFVSTFNSCNARVVRGSKKEKVAKVNETTKINEHLTMSEATTRLKVIPKLAGIKEPTNASEPVEAKKVAEIHEPANVQKPDDMEEEDVLGDPVIESTEGEDDDVQSDEGEDDNVQSDEGEDDIQSDEGEDDDVQSDEGEDDDVQSDEDEDDDDEMNVTNISCMKSTRARGSFKDFKLFLQNNDANDTDIDLTDKALFDGEITYNKTSGEFSWPCGGQIDTIMNRSDANYVESSITPSGLEVQVILYKDHNENLFKVKVKSKRKAAFEIFLLKV